MTTPEYRILPWAVQKFPEMFAKSLCTTLQPWFPAHPPSLPPSLPSHCFSSSLYKQECTFLYFPLCSCLSSLIFHLEDTMGSWNIYVSWETVLNIHWWLKMCFCYITAVFCYRHKCEWQLQQSQMVRFYKVVGMDPQNMCEIKVIVKEIPL